MKTRLRLFAMLAALPAGAQEKPAGVDEILARVQAQKASYEASLPDFLCDEKRTSQRFRADRPDWQATSESAFRVERNIQHKGKSPFIETRQIVSMNGKPSRAKRFKGPLTFEDGVAAAFSMFAVDNARCYNYRLEGQPESASASPVLRIAFASRPGQSEPGGACADRLPDQTGEIVVDAETYSVVRFEARSPHPGPKNAVLTYSVEFSKTPIGGDVFWMPSEVKAELTNTEKPVRLVYTARYSNYRKFEASSSVTYAAP